ncbi:hypothetical protein AGMMS50229_07280 [Campylobacterota bacterium]|nr:hypothetical protein AGMMS50229_07280 [Campylobacterota bacterium]
MNYGSASILSAGLVVAFALSSWIDSSSSASAAASENVVNTIGLSNIDDALIYRYAANSEYGELYAAAATNAAKNAEAIAKSYGKGISIARSTNVQADRVFHSLHES